MDENKELSEFFDHQAHKLHTNIEKSYLNLPISVNILQGYVGPSQLTFSVTSPEESGMVIDAPVLAITHSDPAFSSTISSGFLGLSPMNNNYYIKEKPENVSILYYMKMSGIIDYAIISIFLTLNKKSYLKFGGYDVAAFAN